MNGTRERLTNRRGVMATTPETRETRKRRRPRDQVLGNFAGPAEERSALDQYLRDVSRHELITPEEEIELGRRAQAGDEEAVEGLEAPGSGRMGEWGNGRMGGSAWSGPFLSVSPTLALFAMSVSTFDERHRNGQLDRARLERLQLDKLNRLLGEVAAQNAFYRRKLSGGRTQLESIAQSA